MKKDHRIQLDNPYGDKGTIRYVGAIEGAKNPVYVGVEWDKSRPKGHDGTVKGRTYFSCPKGYGSYVHPKRVLLGKSMVEAMAIRYGGVQDPDEERIEAFEARKLAVGNSNEGGEASTSADQVRHPVDFKLVGEEKIRNRLKQYSLLEHAGLEGMRISCSGDLNLLSSLKRLKSLSLENNLLKHWHQVLPHHKICLHAHICVVLSNGVHAGTAMVV